MQVLLMIFFSFCTLQSKVSSFELVREHLVGGTQAYNGEFPYQVSIKHEKQHKCGGSLITRQHVLTAAHCLTHYVAGGQFAGQLDKVSVVVGTASLYGKGQEYEVTAVYPHEYYDNARVFNDIGIIKLAKNVTLSKLVSTIKLPGYTNLKPKTKLMLIGYGTYYSGDPKAGHHPVSSVLRKVEVEVVSLDECRESWRDSAEIRQTNICTSTANTIGSCVGDSGGPLVYQGTIHGIVSFGEGYCADGVPDVATKVASYLDWIGKTLKKPDIKKPTTPYLGWYWGIQNYGATNNRKDGS